MKRIGGGGYMACLGTNANREDDAVLQKLALFQDFLAYNTEVSRIVC
jgi:hypothetical protein